MQQALTRHPSIGFGSRLRLQAAVPPLACPLANTTPPPESSAALPLLWRDLPAGRADRAVLIGRRRAGAVKLPSDRRQGHTAAGADGPRRRLPIGAWRKPSSYTQLH